MMTTTWIEKNAIVHLPSVTTYYLHKILKPFSVLFA